MIARQSEREIEGLTKRSLRKGSVRVNPSQNVFELSPARIAFDSSVAQMEQSES